MCIRDRARDGWLMYQMARYLCERKALSIECRYLYASRYAWRIPEQHLIGEKAMERICRSGLDVTFAAMMRRAGLTKEEGSRIAALIRPGRKETDILSWKEIQNLRGPLSSCREFIELADFHFRECYGDTLSYLEQEGLLDAVPYGVVDSGWIGTMQESLQHLLEGAGCGGEVEGYYFGLYNLCLLYTSIRRHAGYIPVRIFRLKRCDGLVHGFLSGTPEDN